LLDRVRGYLTHKKHLPSRTLQYDYTEGHVVVIEGLFLMSEVPM